MSKVQLLNLGNDDVYYVKNKDKDLMSFRWEIIDDETATPIDVTIIDDSTPLFICNGLASWLESRTPPKHRQFMYELLSSMNMKSVKDVIDFSKGLSLNDTFWVANDRHLTWDSINLFDNEFDETISRIAFDGGLFGKRVKTTSPEFGTNGMLPKCWVRESDGIVYLKKGGTSGACNTGLEPYSEVLASQLLDTLGYNHVTYTVENFRGKLVSSCPLFTSKSIGMIPMYLVCSIGSVFNIVNFCKLNKIADELYRMLIFDYLSLNSDRHGNNFAVLFDTDTYALKGLAPIYDNGASMLNYYVLGSSLDEYTKNYVPQLYDSFSSLAKYSKKNISIPHNVNNLIGFKFDRSQVPGYSNDRLDFLEEFIQGRVQEFLSW